MFLRYYIVLSLFPSLMLALVCRKPERKGKKQVSHSVCCDGYRSVGGSGSGLKCDPICHEDCGSGKCVSPNTCSCNEGYDNIEHNPAYGCVPVCKKGCKNGECVAPETCRCYTGYKLEESTGQCAPICSGGCHNGHCESPGQCVCNEGYSKVDVECQPDCEEKCGENRLCVAPNKCDCDEGYAEIDKQCLSIKEKVPISNTINTTRIEDNPSIADKMTDVIGFLRHWMIEILVVLAFVIILIMALFILISKLHQRNNDVAQREKDRPLYACDNEMEVLEVESGPVYKNTIQNSKN